MSLDISSIDGTDESEIHAQFAMLDQAIENRHKAEALEYIRTIVETLRTLSLETQTKLWPILQRRVQNAEKKMYDAETDTRTS